MQLLSKSLHLAKYTPGVTIQQKTAQPDLRCTGVKAGCPIVAKQHLKMLSVF